MRVFVDRAGKWSGGGAVMLDNLRWAADRWPAELSLRSSPDGARLVPRNVPTGSLRGLGRTVLAPQNAWPWHLAGVNADERGRVLRLRAASELCLLRAAGMLRISSAIPCRRGRRCSPVLHNVLDAGFDTALRAAPGRPGIDVSRSLVSVGSIYSYRNLERLLTAHALYRRGGGRLDLLLVGPPGSPEAVRRLTPLLTDEVRVLAEPMPRPAALALMREAAGVVLPSLVEASPVTALEAVAVSGRVLLSDIVGHREILAPAGSSGAGTFCDAGSTGALAAGLLQLEQGARSAAHTRLADAEFRVAERNRWADQLVGWLTALLSGR